MEQNGMHDSDPELLTVTLVRIGQICPEYQGIALVMVVGSWDSSVSETHGAQEGGAYDGHFGCTCCHQPFVFNQFGNLAPGDDGRLSEGRRIEVDIRRSDCRR